METSADSIDNQSFKEQLNELLTKKGIPSEKSICEIINNYLLNVLELIVDDKLPQFFFHNLFIYLRIQLDHRSHGGFDFFPLDLTKYLEDHPGIKLRQVHSKPRFCYNFDSGWSDRGPIRQLENLNILEVKEDTTIDFRGHKICRINPSRINNLKSIVTKISRDIDVFWKEFEVEHVSLESDQEEKDIVNPVLPQIQQQSQSMDINTIINRYDDSFLTRFYEVQELILNWVKLGSIIIENILESNDVDILDISDLLDAALKFEEDNFTKDILKVLDDVTIIKKLVDNSSLDDLFRELGYLESRMPTKMPDVGPFLSKLADKIVIKLLSTNDMDALWYHRFFHPDVTSALFSRILSDPSMLLNDRDLFFFFVQNSNFDQDVLKIVLEFILHGASDSLDVDESKLQDYLHLLNITCANELTLLDNDIRADIIRRIFSLFGEILQRISSANLADMIHYLLGCFDKIKPDFSAHPSFLKDVGIAVSRLIDALGNSNEQEKIDVKLNTIEMVLEFLELHEMQNHIPKEIEISTLKKLYLLSKSWQFDAKFYFMEILAKYFNEFFQEIGGFARFFELLDQNMDAFSETHLTVLKNLLGQEYRPIKIYRYLKHAIDSAISSGGKNACNFHYNIAESGILNYETIVLHLKEYLKIHDESMIRKLVSLKDFPRLLRRSNEEFAFDLAMIEHVFSRIPTLFDEDLVRS